jgi:hypothetical protein
MNSNEIDLLLGVEIIKNKEKFMEVNIVKGKIRRMRQSPLHKTIVL